MTWHDSVTQALKGGVTGKRFTIKAQLFPGKRVIMANLQCGRKTWRLFVEGCAFRCPMEIHNRGRGGFNECITAMQCARLQTAWEARRIHREMVASRVV